jgi:hypothetical protein
MNQDSGLRMDSRGVVTVWAEWPDADGDVRALTAAEPSWPAIENVVAQMTSPGAGHKERRGFAGLWALGSQLLGGLRSRLLVVGQWPDGGGQQCTVRDVQHTVLGRQRRVEQPNRSHGAVQGAA